MNISYSWLKDLIDIEMTPDELAQRLTRVGLAVEGVHPAGDDFVAQTAILTVAPGRTRS